MLFVERNAKSCVAIGPSQHLKLRNWPCSLRGPDSERITAPREPNGTFTVVVSWVSCAPRPQLCSILYSRSHSLMHAVAVPKGVCWSCCPSISNRSTSSSMGGVRTYIVGFHSATTWGQGPAQYSSRSISAFFGTSDVVSKRPATPCQFSVIQMHCLPPAVQPI